MLNPRLAIVDVHVRYDYYRNGAQRVRVRGLLVLLSRVLWSNLFQVMVRVGSVLDLGLVSVRVRVRLELALG